MLDMLNLILVILFVSVPNESQGQSSTVVPTGSAIAIANVTLEIRFVAENWTNAYLNKSSFEYTNKTGSILSILKKAFEHDIQNKPINVTNLTSGSLIATTLFQITGELNKTRINGTVGSLGAVLVDTTALSRPSSISTNIAITKTSIATTAPNDHSISTTSSNLKLSTSSVHYSKSISSTSTSQSSIVSTAHTMSSTFNVNSTINSTAFSEGTKMYSKSTSMVSKIITTNPPSTNSTAFSESTKMYSTSTSMVSKIITTTPPNTNLYNSTNSTIIKVGNNTTIPTKANATENTRSSSNIYDYRTITTTAVSSIGVNNTSSMTRISQISTRSSISTRSTISTSISATRSSISTPTLPSYIYLNIQFLKEVWNEIFTNVENNITKEKINDLQRKIALAFKLAFSLVKIYSLKSGSIIVNTSLQSPPLPNDQISSALKTLDAQLVMPTTTIPTTSISQTSTVYPLLPIYAIILIAIFSTVVFIAIVFVFAAVICRHRRLKGYGQHQVQFFEMENGWKYGRQNSSYQSTE